MEEVLVGGEETEQAMVGHGVLIGHAGHYLSVVEMETG